MFVQLDGHCVKYDINSGSFQAFVPTGTTLTRELTLLTMVHSSVHVILYVLHDFTRRPVGSILKKPPD